MAEQVFYEIARWRLDEQLAQIRELNGRLMGAFTGATALLILFGALQNLERLTDSPAAIALVAIGATVYVLLVIAAILGYRDPNLRHGPELADASFTDADETVARFAVAAKLAQAFAENEPHVRRKARVVFVCLSLWAVDVLLLLAASLVATV